MKAEFQSLMMNRLVNAIFKPPLIVIEVAETEDPEKANLKITIEGFDYLNSIKVLESAITILQKEKEEHGD